MSLSYPMRWKPNIRAHSWKPNERIDHHTGRKPKLSPNKEWEKKECTTILGSCGNSKRAELGWAIFFCHPQVPLLSLSLSLCVGFLVFFERTQGCLIFFFNELEILLRDKTNYTGIQVPPWITETKEGVLLWLK